MPEKPTHRLLTPDEHWLMRVARGSVSEDFGHISELTATPHSELTPMRKKRNFANDLSTCSAQVATDNAEEEAIPRKEDIPRHERGNTLAGSGFGTDHALPTRPGPCTKS